MGEIIEAVISGFCKRCDRAQTVICEYIEEDGKMVLDDAGCMFKRCENYQNCVVMKAAHEKFDNEKQ